MSNIYKLPNVKRDVKIPVVKIESGRNNRVTIRIPYNKELLVNAHSKTTEIYTYVSTKDISAIKSPLDNLIGEGEI